jgi:squalene-associated FAD-dependent desaturase
MRVAVVGGGLAGLAAALACADGGAAVTLFEARRRLGGATFSIERDGYVLDNGQHVALRCCDEYVAFLRRIGSEANLPFQPRLRIPVLRPGRRTAWIARNGLPAPLHLVFALLRYAPLPLRDRLAAVRAAAALRTLDPDDPALDDRTFGEWLREHGQSALGIEALWDLIALPTLNLHADQASLALAAKVFRTGLLDANDAADVGLPAVPLARLHAEPAADALRERGARLVLGTRVVRVEEGVRIHYADESERFDAAIVAVPHTAVNALLPELPDESGLGTSPIVNLHVHFDRPVLEHPFAAAVDSPLQWLFDRTAASGVRSGQLVCVSLSAAADEHGLSVAELRERYLPELERLLPRAREARVLRFEATHEPQATFAGVPGTRALRPGPHTSVHNVFLAGAWTDTGWPATMESAVRSGNAAARAALAAAAAAPEPAEVLR